MGKYYAVRNGRTTGVFNSWNDCKGATHGYSGAVFKSFNSQAEAQAFANSSGGYNSGSGSSGGTSSSYSGKTSSYSGRKSLYSGGGGASKTPYSGRKSSSSTSSHDVVYTDGCSRGNGKSGATGGIGVYYGTGDKRNVSEPLHGERQTNQRAELTAAIRAIDNAISDAKPGKTAKGLDIHTDSEYASKSLTEWGDKWEKNDYTRNGKPISNLDLVKEGREKINEYNAIYGSKNGVKFTHVRGHTGVEGNENADRLANQGAGY